MGELEGLEKISHYDPLLCVQMTAFRRRLKQDHCFESQASLGFIVKSCHFVSKNKTKQKPKNLSLVPRFPEVHALSFLETTFPTHFSFKVQSQTGRCGLSDGSLSKGSLPSSLHCTLHRACCPRDTTLNLPFICSGLQRWIPRPVLNQCLCLADSRSFMGACPAFVILDISSRPWESWRQT